MSNLEFAPSADTTTADLLDGRQIDCSSLLADSPLVGLGYLPSPNAPAGSADRFATFTLGSMFKYEDTENGPEYSISRPYAEMPRWMQSGTNLVAACWLGRALVSGSERVAVIDLNHAETMTDNLGIFVDELSATDLCGVVAAEPEGNVTEKMSQAADCIKRIIGGLDHLIVVSTDTSHVRIAHNDMRDKVLEYNRTGALESLKKNDDDEGGNALEVGAISAVAA
jgi:hypothetical protein